MNINGYKHIGITDGVCDGRPILLGTRLEPINIVNYGTIEESMEDFDLTEEQVKECFKFIDRVIETIEEEYFRNKI